MEEQENLRPQQTGPQSIGDWVKFLLHRNSTLELVIKVAILLVVVSWIEGHYLSWTKRDVEPEKLTNLGCVVPAYLMVDLQIPKPVEDSTDMAGYLLKRDEFDAQLLADRADLKRFCWK